MSVIAKFNKRNGQCDFTGEQSIKGSVGVMKYITSQNLDKIDSLSVINYYQKGNPNEVSSTRFELTIGDTKSFAVSYRIIAKKEGNAIKYYVEMLATTQASYTLDEVFNRIKVSRYAKNGSDIYVLDREELLSCLAEVYKHCPKLR